MARRWLVARGPTLLTRLRALSGLNSLLKSVTLPFTEELRVLAVCSSRDVDYIFAEIACSPVERFVLDVELFIGGAHGTLSLRPME